MKDLINSIQAHIQAQAKYGKNNTAGFYMKLNIHTDLGIIRRLWNQPSKQETVKNSSGKKSENPLSRPVPLIFLCLQASILRQLCFDTSDSIYIKFSTFTNICLTFYLQTVLSVSFISGICYSVLLFGIPC